MRTERTPRYQSDMLGGRRVRLDNGVEENLADGGIAPLGLHDETLFDEDETQAGDRIDLATGLQYDNSKSYGSKLLEYVISEETETEAVQADDAYYDVMPQLAEEDDNAAKWIAGFEAVTIAQIEQDLEYEELHDSGETTRAA